MPESLLANWRLLPSWASELGWYMVFFATVFPLEAMFGSERKPGWGERIGNVAAMLVYFGLGTFVLEALEKLPLGERLAAFPAESRLEILKYPLVWALTSVFLVDGLFYVYHRLQHSFALFWRVHKLHHTDPAMNITTTHRTHFLERTLQYLCLTTPMFWTLGKNLPGVSYAALITMFFLYLGHADIRLDLGPLTPIVVGPMFHRLHHSRHREHRNVNFAQIFPLFDILGGTYRRPRAEEHPDTGIEGCESDRERWRPLLG